jgi:16S rRNA G966 N2-methylase RsmD
MDRVKVALFDYLDNLSTTNSYHTTDLENEQSKEVDLRRNALDAFAGAGSWGIEAISRNLVSEVVFLELSAPALEVLRTNLKNLGLIAPNQALSTDSNPNSNYPKNYLKHHNSSSKSSNEDIIIEASSTKPSEYGENSCQIKRIDSFAYLRKSRKSFDYIFLDPPQKQGLWLSALTIINQYPRLLKPQGLVVVKLHPYQLAEQGQLQLHSLTLLESRRHGNTQLLFYRNSST